MRPAWLVAALVVPLLACDSSNAVPTTVSWMDWPADVQAATPFRVRMVVQWPCAAEGFHVGSRIDVAAVTLKPFFERQNRAAICALEESQVVDLVIGSLDTAGYAPPLRVGAKRVFEMRAAHFASSIGSAAQSSAGAMQTFGVVIVHPSSDPLPELSRRNVGGTVRVEVDQTGCVRIRPVGAYGPNASIVLDDPADTLGLSGRFVQGYIYEPAAARCGETEVFHWVKVYALD